MIEINKEYTTASLLRKFYINKKVFREYKEEYLNLLSEYLDYEYYKRGKSYYFKINEILVESLPDKISLRDNKRKEIEYIYVEELKLWLKKYKGYVSGSALGRYIYYECGNPGKYKNELGSIRKAREVIKKYTNKFPNDIIYVGTYWIKEDEDTIRLVYQILNEKQVKTYKELVKSYAESIKLDSKTWKDIKVSFQIETAGAVDSCDGRGFWIVTWKRHYLISY